MSALHLIASERLLVLVGWAFVVMWTPGASRAVLGGKVVKTALIVTGLAIISFQLNVISGAVSRRTDYWTAFNLAALALAAAIFLAVLLPRSPDSNRIAVALAAFAVVAACFVGGNLA